MFAEERQNAYWGSLFGHQAKTCERNQAERFGPFLIVNTSVVRDIVGKEFGFNACGNTPDLVTAERNSPVHLSVNVGVAAGTGHQMETAIPVSTYVGALCDLSVHAAGITSIAGSGDPYPSKVRIKSAH